MLTYSREAALFILSEACSCRLELAYFVRKISTKNRLVCKNAVALAYYESWSDRILPMGFNKKGTIGFDHRENTRENRLPSVSTYLPQLRLPACDSLTEDYDVFKEQMNLAVLGSVGFGDL